MLRPGTDVNVLENGMRKMYISSQSKGWVGSVHSQSYALFCDLNRVLSCNSMGEICMNSHSLVHNSGSSYLDPSVKYLITVIIKIYI